MISFGIKSDFWTCCLRIQCVAWLKTWDLLRQIHCSIPPQTIRGDFFLFNLLGFTFTARGIFLFLAAKIARIFRMNCELTNPMMLCGFPYGTLSLLPGSIEFCGCRHHHNGIEPENQILFIFNQGFGENWNLLDRFMRSPGLSGTRWWMLTRTRLLSSRSCFYKKCIKLFIPNYLTDTCRSPEWTWMS